MTTFITVQEAADEQGVSPQTIRNWIDWGLIKAIKVQKNPSSQRAGKLYVDKDSLEEAEASGKI